MASLKVNPKYVLKIICSTDQNITEDVAGQIQFNPPLAGVALNGCFVDTGTLC